MNHAFLLRSKFNERANRNDSGDNTFVNLTYNRLKDYRFNHCTSSFKRSLVHAGNEYGAVLFDIDLSACICNDLLDNASLLTDNVGDLINGNLHCYHLRSIFGNLRSGCGNCLEYYFINDVVASLVGNCESFLDYLRRKTVYLEVHLNGGDTLVSSGYLEVHVSVEVFKTLNVYHRHPSVAFGDKTAGNSGYGSLYRHACIHESKCRAAYGRL